MRYMVMDIGFGLNNINILQDDCGDTLVLNCREEAETYRNKCKIGIIIEIPEMEGESCI